MKMDRLIGILTLLLQEDKTTAPELAKRFEVSRRTINRDIDTLCQAGIPIVTIQGSGGGISIANGYKIEKTFFTQDEMQAIIAGVKGMDSVSKKPYSPNLSYKLSAENNIIAENDIIKIDLASYYQNSLIQKIDIFKHAITHRITTSFLYFSATEESGRTIEPYHIIFRWSAWYIFGYCQKRNAFRMFKLNRLWHLKETGKHFIPRAIAAEQMEFDWNQAPSQVHLKASFSEKAKYRLIEEYGIDSFSVSANGQLLFECDFANFHYMLAWVLSFGDKITVIEPLELKEELYHQIQNILKKLRQT